MVATRLDGTAIAKAIRERLGADIAQKQKLNPRYKPSLKIIQGPFVLYSDDASFNRCWTDKTCISWRPL